MALTPETIKILSEEMAAWLEFSAQFENKRTPSVKELDAFLLERLQINEDEQRPKVAVLLKPSAESKRMRELAGIPHKGNYV